MNSNTYSTFNILPSEVPQGSILGPIMFKIFINDLFLLIRNPDLHNFADNNTISSVANNIEELLKTWEKSSEEAIHWFRNISKTAKPGKFQSVIIDNKNSNHNPQDLNTGIKVIDSQRSVKHLGIEIDDENWKHSKKSFRFCCFNTMMKCYIMTIKFY